ncbi:hypothetical protein JCGZ_25460 [Jatropha curcas]|uniref:Uncharacterized protein n=1 Tax=Jatropha curcas TaxID=180498 RepID=A0A067LFR9_JATCU|nr:hypothetical protein JCGZ_25460 [Jatropha curcas]
MKVDLQANAQTSPSPRHFLRHLQSTTVTATTAPPPLLSSSSSSSFFPFFFLSFPFFCPAPAFASLSSSSSSSSRAPPPVSLPLVTGAALSHVPPRPSSRSATRSHSQALCQVCCPYSSSTSFKPRCQPLLCLSPPLSATVSGSGHRQLLPFDPARIARVHLVLLQDRIKARTSLSITFGDGLTDDVDSVVGEVRGRKENVWIVDVPSDIDEGELLDICFTYNLSLEYKLIRPSESMRVTEPLDEDSIMMYEESFRSGVRFPLSEPLKLFFNEYHITISQLHPNGLRFLCCIIELARQDGYNVMARTILLNRWSEDPLRHVLASPTPYGQTCMELIKAMGLGCVNLRQVITKGYLTYLPSGPMRPNPSIRRMAPKKLKSSNMAKVAKVMKKKITAKGLGKEVPSEVPSTRQVEVDVTARVAPSELPPSSLTTGPPRKRQRETNVPAFASYPPPAHSWSLDIRGHFIHKYGVNYSLQDDMPS